MARVYSVHVNPYKDLAESIVTSTVIDVSDAFDVSVSWFTTSGATSLVTYQISNSGAADSADIAAGSWSRWTRFGNIVPADPSEASIFFPPLGARYVRMLRKVSNASITIDFNKLVR